MATTNYVFYGVINDPIKPFLILVKRFDGCSEAHQAVLSRRVHYLTTDKERAGKMADTMSKRMMGVTK